MDWLMKTVTKQNKRAGIHWTLTSVLEDLDYADDISLLASKYTDIQEKPNASVRYSQTDRPESQHSQDQMHEKEQKQQPNHCRQQGSGGS